MNPAVIHLSFTCFGDEGPWASWVGFDPHALAVTGPFALEGSLAEQAVSTDRGA